MSAARVRRSRSAIAAEALAVRLVGEAALRAGASVSLSSSASRTSAVSRARSRRDAGTRAATVCMSRAAHGLVAAQQVVRLEPGGLERDVGGDPRVPVPVRRRSTTRGGAAPGGSTGRVPVRPASPASAVPAGASAAGPSTRIERPVDGPLEAGDGDEQRLVEDRQLRADLVQRRRRDRPQVARVPQERDLLAQPAAQVGVLVGRDERDRRARRAGAGSGAGRRAACADGPRWDAR